MDEYMCEGESECVCVCCVLFMVIVKCFVAYCRKGTIYVCSVVISIIKYKLLIKKNLLISYLTPFP